MSFDSLNRARLDFFAVHRQNGLFSVQVNTEMRAFGGLECCFLLCQPPLELACFHAQIINIIVYMRKSILVYSAPIDLAQKICILRSHPGDKNKNLAWGAKEYYVAQNQPTTEKDGKFMGNRKSIASILLFAGSALCFFLPFVTVSCGGQKIFTFSGQQLATGTKITGPQVFGPPKTQRTDADPFAAVAGLCALAGIGLSLAGRKLAVAAAASGAVGAASLGVMASRMDAQIQHATEGIGQANLEVGFTLTLGLLIAAAAWNVYLVIRGRSEASSSGIAGDNSFASSGAGASPPVEVQAASNGSSSAGPDGQVEQAPSPADQADFGFCGDCGAKLKKASGFCGACGSRI